MNDLFTIGKNKLCYELNAFEKWVREPNSLASTFVCKKLFPSAIELPCNLCLGWVREHCNVSHTLTKSKWSVGRRYITVVMVLKWVWKNLLAINDYIFNEFVSNA